MDMGPRSVRRLIGRQVSVLDRLSRDCSERSEGVDSELRILVVVVDVL